ncbi:3-dehydroquinate synthase [Tropicimonas sp. IMCC6043]|uniref:3-dehydroquinate synthase n=1 Tax=Tropicimonas sp. IMCC6043 TaxID=2510645 RepID=UPI00101B8710|nr:3-dehydroquinate synthase [Tropicimonas sp. IMCC6043]RYH10403.1 3-dehydroquinate synthase [Tropicimonas sp. IMCC6043]
MMEIVQVPLGARSYEIGIGSGILTRAGYRLAPLLKRPLVAVVTDEKVAALHLPKLREALAAEGIEMAALVLPSGEATKSWPHFERCVEWLLEHRIERSDLIVAFGGGVIGDLVGFAAAVVRRGVRFVQIPTTLLAQVDSSVGGKTAINSTAGKNLIGAFYQPSLVLADVDLLETLDRRDFLAGYGEVVKYGLLGDLSFFEWLEKTGPALAEGNTGARIAAVKLSCRMKADIVTRDETEQGDRALLNLGHTFAHALEAATGYSDRLLHGEAVAIGCALAVELSARLGYCSQEDPSRVRAHLRHMGMKVDLGDIPGELPDAGALLRLMEQDKKVVAGRMHYVLTRGIGRAFVTSEVPAQEVLGLLRRELEQTG